MPELHHLTRSKKCSRCDQIKLMDQFNKRSKHSTGHEPHCRACQRERLLQARLGISHGTYLDMHKLQGGACGICGQTITHRHLDVDHSHKTGLLRGLLCRHCNRGLGFFQDCATNLRKAARYLLKWERRHSKAIQ